MLIKYLKKQAHRFEDRDLSTFPSNLKPTQIMGVDYVSGQVEGTGSALWVVGKDPDLFDYFLPEKWRDTRRIKQSVFGQVYRTTTKDDINLVWKVSRVGQLPDWDPIKHKEKRELSTTILIPCKNERGNIESAIKRIPIFGNHQEIIFVDGHSTDGTREEINRIITVYPEKDIKLILQDGQGKGDAVRKGFAAAKGEILMILDADLTVPPEDLPKFYRALAENHGEFINGCRLVYPMEKQAMRFLNYFGNKFFSIMFTWILNQRFKDTLCGTKALLKKDYEKIRADRSYFGNFDPFGDFDLIFGAVKQNLKVIEVPIRYRERTYGRTNISRFYHGWLLMKMTLFAYKKIKAI